MLVIYDYHDELLLYERMRTKNMLAWEHLLLIDLENTHFYLVDKFANASRIPPLLMRQSKRDRLFATANQRSEGRND